MYGFVEMMIYIAILLVGYFYLWKKGAFDWHKISRACGIGNGDGEYQPKH